MLSSKYKCIEKSKTKVQIIGTLTSLHIRQTKTLSFLKISVWGREGEGKGTPSTVLLQIIIAQQCRQSRAFLYVGSGSKTLEIRLPAPAVIVHCFLNVVNSLESTVVP